ncbi:MAG: hypothetical protein AAB533_02240 [Patescibacteria group bacterium]
MEDKLDSTEALAHNLRRRWKRNPMGTIILLCLICLGNIVFAFFTAMGTRLYSSFEEIFHRQDIQTTAIQQSERPSLGLTYEKTEEYKDESTGIYSTTFLLTLNVPPYFMPYYPDGRFSLLWTGDTNRECGDLQSLGSTWEFAGSYSSTTKRYEITCKTYRPILDNKRLFSVVEKAE